MTVSIDPLATSPTPPTPPPPPDRPTPPPTGLAELPNLPDSVRLKDILQTLPRECFQQDPTQAWRSVALSVAAVVVGYAAIALAPVYLLPLAWLWTGTALTGWFVIGHDCGHRSFARRKWVNDLVGHVAMLPLIYPFHAWRILHDRHHRYTNQLENDNAWEPFSAEHYDGLNPIVRRAYWVLRGWGWWLGSIAHWSVLHFTWWKFSGKERQQIRFSALVAIAAGAIGLPLLVATTGWWGLVQFWLMPWLVYHFWMSTFTIVHHTDLGIPFKSATVWHEATAQLCGSVHCQYPRWVEILCHDINVHIPHHLTPSIPSYHLRQAHASLRQNWGEFLKERQFNWQLMGQIANYCHLYHPDRNYQSFREQSTRA